MKTIALIILLSFLAGCRFGYYSALPEPDALLLIESDKKALEDYKPIGLVHVENWSWNFMWHVRFGSELEHAVKKELALAAAELGADAVTNLMIRSEVHNPLSVYPINFTGAVHNFPLFLGWTEFHASGIALARKTE